MNTRPHSESWPGLQTFAAREELLLAPFATHSVDSAGRKHPEDEHAYRGPFQRDRDRVLHSAAYRRLSGKMQVFTGDRGDYHRTRLTHTLEVASIARTIGRALRLNEDLVEALAFLHDIGHPPFGHAGEAALDECLAGQGGFSHNRHALTVAEDLEVRYQRFPGLNLTREVLDGQTARIDKSSPDSRPLLEVQVVDAADSITYDAHDVDDAVKLGLIGLDEMLQLPLIRESARLVRENVGALDATALRKALVHELIDRQVGDVLQASGTFLAGSGWTNGREAQASDFRIGPGSDLAEQKAELESFLYDRVYRHPELIRVRDEARHRLRLMFEGFVRHAELLPAKFQLRAERVGLRRAVGEFLAAMTDRYCEQQYRRHRSIFEDAG